jgi:arylsulfatase A-like enzyme
VVLDTTRADAVSAYGEVRGTTPTLDGLARTGLLYTHAYSNANWTLPSHASLFTGLLPSEHGVRYGNDVLADGITTLADVLRARGYDTVAFSENPWLGASTRTDRGFDSFSSKLTKDISEAFGDWLAARSDDRPFFVFLNVMDAHWPYDVRATNAFLPEGVTRERALSVARSSPMFCIHQRGDPESDILHALYLGDVQAADAKLGRILGRLDRVTGPLIVVVTSDHGEYFGERGLLEHGLGLGTPVLHVPLVIHGLPRSSGLVIDTPVQLLDLMPSILGWAGAPVPAGLQGHRLPTASDTDAASRPIVAQHWDEYTDEQMPPGIRDTAAWRRSHCGPQDKVNGDAHVLIRFPYEFVWYAQYAPELYDLRNDPDESHDLAPTSPELVSELSGELSRRQAATPPPAAGPRPTLDSATVERLRALGYAVP